MSDQSSAARDSLRRKMREIADAYAAQLPARDLHSLMQGEALRGVKLHVLPMGERDGAYDPASGVILINQHARPERQRFTLAHEISHALLLASDDLLSDLHDAFEGEALEHTIEMLCNLGASALLISPAELEACIQRFGLSGRALAYLARRTQVSGSAALYALLEAASAQGARLLLGICTPDAAGALLVRVSAASSGVNYTLRAGTPIPPDHPAFQALETRLPTRERSYVPFRSGRKMPAWVDAFPEPARRRVFVSFDLDVERKGSAYATLGG